MFQRPGGGVHACVCHVSGNRGRDVRCRGDIDRLADVRFGDTGLYGEREEGQRQHRESRVEIQAILAATGVPNAAQWAREVEEYRPYPADDPSWAKLRKELAKYNPAAGVVDQIVAVLTP